MYFSVSLLFKTSQIDPLWEERIVLINADSEKEACAKAKLLGKKAEHSYTANTGEIIEWKFECIESTYLIEDDKV